MPSVTQTSNYERIQGIIMNRLFMVGLAKEHEIVTQRIKVKKVTFGTFGEGNALSVKGKKKSIVRFLSLVKAKNERIISA